MDYKNFLFMFAKIFVWPLENIAYNLHKNPPDYLYVIIVYIYFTSLETVYICSVFFMWSINKPEIILLCACA